MLHKGYNNSVEIDDSNGKVKSLYIDGYMDYRDSATQLTPINYTASSVISIPCDGLDQYSYYNFKPYNVTNLWNTITNRFTFSELAIGDEIEIAVELVITTLSANTLIECYMTFDIGGNPYDKVFTPVYYKTTGTYTLSVHKKMYIGNTGTKNNPGAVYFKADGNCTIKVNGIYITTKRRFY